MQNSKKGNKNKTVEIVVKHKIRYFFFVTILSFIPYALIASRFALGYGDSSELITDAFTKGTAHPPGYPLLTFVGYYISHLPILNPAHWLNLSSALFHALTIGFIFLSTTLILQEIINKKNDKSENETKLITISALSGSLVLAFSFLFFLYSGIAEVFPLNDLLIALCIYLTLEFRSLWLKNNRSYLYVFYALATTIGLMLSNQQTSILVIPPIVFLLLTTFWQNRERKLVTFAILAGTGAIVSIIFLILPYTTLLYFANHNSLTSWRIAYSWNDLITIMLRKDYTAPGSANAGNIASSYITGVPILNNLGESLHLIGFIINHFLWASLLVIPGIYFLFKADNRIKIKEYIVKQDIPIFITSLFIISGFIFVTYIAFGWDEYGNASFYTDLSVHIRMFLQAETLFGLLTAIGVYPCVHWISKQNISFKNFAIYSFAILIPLSLLVVNFEGANTSYSGFEVMAKDTLISLPKGASLICFTDQSCFSLMYEHYVLNVRPDVALITLTVSKYKNNLHSSYPGLFTTKSPMDKDIILDIIAKNYSKNGVYISFASSDQLNLMGLNANPLYTIPYGYTFKVVSNPTTYTNDEFNKNMGIIKNTDKDIEGNFYDDRDFAKEGLVSSLAILDAQNAYILYNEGFITYAKTLLAEANKLNNSSANLRIDQLGQLDRYMQHVKPQIIPSTSQASYISLGNKYIEDKQLTKAEAAYLDAYMLSPNPEITNKLKSIYLQEGDKEKASYLNG